MALEGMRDVLKDVLKRSLDGLNEQDRLAMAWSVVCGKAMASHGVVTGFADGVLWVGVTDQAWMAQLKSMERQLTAEISRIAGVRVREIHWERKRTSRHE